ncbi:MAG TPA: hypothetical protein VGF30_05255 [Bacteroidia bacterium]
MDKKIIKLISTAWMFVFLITGFAAQAQGKEKFNMGGNERTETGPLLIWSGVAFVLAFTILLIFKIRYDKKKKEEMKEQMKNMATRPRTTGQGHGRSSTSRTRGATS